jgi:hypothetical protein
MNPTTLLGDAEIRCALKARIIGEMQDAVGTVVVEELGLCRHEARVDVLVINGRLHGYEIKSDRDGLRRLAEQARVYSRVLDHATLVIGTAKLTQAVHLIPDWWGVLTYFHSRRDINLKLWRRGRLNSSRCIRSLVELLWLDDALSLLEARGGARGYLSKPRFVVWDRICELYSLDEVAEAVRTRIKARTAAQSVRSCV